MNGYKLVRKQLNSNEYKWCFIDLKDGTEISCTFGFVDLIEEAYQIGLEEGKNESLYCRKI